MPQQDCLSSPGETPVAQRRRRPPPTLRTKTGCLTCRGRRKKCDEKRPTCEACCRNRIVCRWADTKVLVARHEVPERAEQGSTSPASWGTTTERSPSPSDDEEVFDHYQSPNPPQEDRALFSAHRYVSRMNIVAGALETTLEVDLLQHVRQNLLPTLLAASAHPGFQVQGIVLSQPSQPRPLMQALLALSSMHVSSKVPSYNAMAVTYYSKSMGRLRKQVEGNELNGLEDHLLLHVVWFYLFEIWRMRLDHLRGSSVHLKGCLQILHLRRMSPSYRQNAIPRPLERLVAESVLYNFATMAIFDRSLTNVSAHALKDMLGPFLDRPAFPDSSAVANSPVLVAPSELYFIVLEVSQLLHRSPLKTADYLLAIQLEDRVKQLQTEGLNALALEENSMKVLQGPYLYILAIETLLFQLKQPGTSSESLEMCHYVSRAISVLHTDVMDQPCKQYFCWPLLIFSPLLREHEDIVFVRNELQKAWDKSSCGNVLMVIQVLDTFSERRMSGDEVNSVEFLASLQGITQGLDPGLFDQEIFQME